MAEIRISGAQTTPRSESDLRYDPSNAGRIIAGSNDIGGGVQGQYYSANGGATWSQTSLPAVSGDSFQSDPAVDWTTDGGAWALTVGVGLTGNVVRSFRSSDGGASWTFDAIISGTQNNVDKPNLWVDHSPTSPYQNSLYALWWNNGPTYIARRVGASGTWLAPQQISGAETVGGSDGGDIKTNAFGDVFAFWPDRSGRRLYVRKSTDGGATFGATVLIANTFSTFLIFEPAQSGRGALQYITGAAYRTATVNNVYAVWADLAGGTGCNASANAPGSNVSSACTVRIWFSRSTDGGTTWDAPKKINDQTSKNDQFFPRLAIDEVTGDLMVVYYDSVADPGRLKTDIWMQSSTDGGVTWSGASKVTGQQTDESGSGVDANQRGDYIGLTSSAGRFFACWTDRRSGGDEEIWGALIPLVRRSVVFQVDRDHYGQDEIDALRTQPGGAVVRTAFWVAVDGFTARELNVTGAGSFGLGPPVAMSPSAGVSSACTSLVSTDPAFSQDAIQRFRFGYDVDFGSTDDAFAFAGDTEPVVLGTSFRGIPATGLVTFMKQPDPFILQGADTWWLSSDVRLLQVVEGESAFGVQMGSDPFVFLTDVISALDAGQGTAGGQVFDTNTTEDDEVITVAPFVLRGMQLRQVYNFALARVHFRALSQVANNVRVFFRLFAANSTATDFREDSTYRRVPATYPVPVSQYGEHVTPTAGLNGGEYVSIPCFGAPREDPRQAGVPNSLPPLQFDPRNDRNLAATGGPLLDSYYGAFLDINQGGPVLPPTPPTGNTDGPWPPASGVNLETLQQSFIRNDHQCLAVEIAFDPVPIGAGTQPWNSDKFAQRNISWSYVANPGIAASRTAVESFEIRPSPDAGPGAVPDELMIDWGALAPDQVAEIYLPAVDAAAVVATADELYKTHRLSVTDNHTIRCLTGGVTYIPVPEAGPDNANFAGLMTIALPQGIQKGQLYSVVVRQLTTALGVPPPEEPKEPEITAAAFLPQRSLVWRRVLGTFQVDIPVGTKESLVEREELRLSIFRWIAMSVPHDSRWYPVFLRYLEWIVRRVRELGGDPDQIEPSANGYEGVRYRYGDRVGYGDRSGQGERGDTGKVESLIYDHFGDFEGFILELEDGAMRRFDSREPDVEELVRGAWMGRIVVTVVEKTGSRVPLKILLRRSQALRRKRH